MYNLFKVGKIYEDRKLYIQDIQSPIDTDDTDVKRINITVVRNKRKVKTSRNTAYNFLQITHLQLTPSQILITVLNVSRFFEDLMWYGKLFQIFGPNILKLFLPKVTWL